MFQYSPQPGDRSFRKIDLSRFIPTEHLPEFTEISPERRPIPCQPKFVLEILREDGSTAIVGPPEPANITYTKDARGFRISSDVPTARLFVHSTTCPALRYKAPVAWQVLDGLQYCAVGGDPDGLELVGDPCFSARYNLIRR